MAEVIVCEVMFASAPGQITHRQCHAAAGDRLIDVIRGSGVLELHPEIDLSVLRIGVFGKLKTLDQPVAQGDRIEIYRPLQVDPKTARRLRAEKKKKNSV